MEDGEAVRGQAGGGWPRCERGWRSGGKERGASRAAPKARHGAEVCCGLGM
jgi:hypothetical protein